MATGLTLKQEKFVQELIKGKSQREAYKIAYPNCKSADNIVDIKASKLLATDKVRLRYKDLHSKLIKRAEEKAIITAEEILREIVDIAKDDISNYLDFRTEKVFIGHDALGYPVSDYRIIVDTKDSRTINTKNVSEVSLGKDGQFKFKTYCRDTALYKLVEIFGLNEIHKAKQKLAEDRFKHEKEIDGKKFF